MPQVDSVGYEAFGGCDNSVKACISPHTYSGTDIDETTVRYLMETSCFVDGVLTIPNNFTGTVKSGAFKGQSNIKSLNISSIKTIENSAFNGLTGLKTLDMPQVKGIHVFAFSGCTALKEVNMPQTQWIGYNAFENCACLENADMPKAQFIGANAFENCTCLKKADIPEAQWICCNAFSRCTALEEVNMPKITEIYHDAFSGCTALEEVNMPQTQWIDHNAFENCTCLKKANMPKITKIYYDAFSGCTDLEEVNMPQVKEIYDHVFSGCTALKEVNMPTIGSMNYYGMCVFYGCHNLTRNTNNSIKAFVKVFADSNTTLKPGKAFFVDGPEVKVYFNYDDPASIEAICKGSWNTNNYYSEDYIFIDNIKNIDFDEPQKMFREIYDKKYDSMAVDLQIIYRALAFCYLPEDLNFDADDLYYITTKECDYLVNKGSEAFQKLMGSQNNSQFTCTYPDLIKELGYNTVFDKPVKGLLWEDAWNVYNSLNKNSDEQTPEEDA